LLEATVGSCAFTAAAAKSVNQRTERNFFIGLRKGTQLDTNPSPLVAYTLDIWHETNSGGMDNLVCV
jgi:hypothetical protein